MIAFTFGTDPCHWPNAAPGSFQMTARSRPSPIRPTGAFSMPLPFAIPPYIVQFVVGIQLQAKKFGDSTIIPLNPKNWESLLTASSFALFVIQMPY